MTGSGGRIGTIVLPNGSYDEDGLPDVKVPGVVVEMGVAFLKERIKGHIQIVEGEESRDEEDE